MAYSKGRQPYFLEQIIWYARLTSVKTSRVTVRFTRGLHMRPAATLVTLLKRFRSRVVFKAGNRVANARSLLRHPFTLGNP